VVVSPCRSIRPIAAQLCILFLMVTAMNVSTAASECRPFVLDLLVGEPVPVEEMLEDLSTVRLVYIGEIHTIARHHEFQAEIIAKLAEKGIKLALGMEMFSEGQQPVLDNWQQGKDGVDSLIGELGKGHWTNLRDYEKVLVQARALKVPIVGLNASDELVRKVAREGVEALNAEERRLVPEGTDQINPSYDRLLRMRLRVHRAFHEKSLDRIVLAHALRDEIMARAVARFLDSPGGKDRVMVVIAGSGHLNYGFGVPERVERLAKLPYRIMLPTESGELTLSEEEKRQSMPVHISHEDLRFIRAPIADYLHVMPLKEEQDDLERREARR